MKSLYLRRRTGWQTADEYLSGDVRSKLRIAQMAAEKNPDFVVNVEALRKAQPKDLDASEIDERLGATWIDRDYIQQFMEETFDTPFYLQRNIQVNFSSATAEWRITGKSAPGIHDVNAYVTYGTNRANAYKILEETLNLKDIRIYDTYEDADGKKKRVLNKKETTLAQQKQLMEFLKSDSMYKCYCPMLTIMLGTGVRCGELVGLTWDDIDLEKKQIHIRRTLVYKDYGDGLKLHVSAPKTKSGIRTIPMSDSVYNAFTEQKELNSLLGRNRNEYEVEGLRNFVFITRNSRPLLMNSVNKILTNIVKAINAQEPEEPFPPVSAHTMRHTFCTRMAENGMDIKVLQHIMGHANINITMQVYNHIADSSRIENELARINALAVNF